MAILEGTTGQPPTGAGVAGPVRFAGPDLADSQHRMDGPRQPDPSSGPLPIASPSVDVPDLAEVRASLLRAGPDVDDVLELVVRHAAGLLDAPARLAEPVDGHLVWTRAFGDDDADLGATVDTDDTLSGAAWRSGLVQLNSPGLSTSCCGSPRSALAVPIAHARDVVAGRHSSSGLEVFALIVLTADRPGWFDRADVRSMLAMEEAAADRIAELHADVAIGSDPSHPGSGPSAFGELDDIDVLSGPADVEALDEPEAADDADQPDRGLDEAGVPARDPADRSSPINLPQFNASLFIPRSSAVPGGAAGPAPGGELSDAARAELYDFRAAHQRLTQQLQDTGGSGFGGWFDHNESPSEPPPSQLGPVGVPLISDAEEGAGARDERDSRDLEFSDTSPLGMTLDDAYLDEADLESDPDDALGAPASSYPDASWDQSPITPRTPTPGLRAPVAPALFQSSASRPGPAPAAPSPSWVQPSEPQALVAGPQLPDVPEQRSHPPELTAAALPLSPIHPAQVVAAQAEVFAQPEVAAEHQVAPQSEVIEQPLVIHSRKRKPWMQPASTLPPAMPAPDSMGLWQWDAVTGECVWSSPVSKLLGVAADVPLDLTMLRAAVAPSDQERFDLAVQAVSTGRGVAGALRLNGPQLPDGTSGRPRTAYAWSEVRRDTNGVLLGAWGGVVDITAFEHDAAQLRSGLTAQRAAQELAGLATWQWHPASRELVWSPEMYRLLGVDPEAFTPTLDGWHAFVHPDDVSQARMLDLGAVEDSARRAERVETFRLIGAGGEIRHVQSWSAVSDDGSANPTVYGATIDVTRQVQDRVMLEHLSITDPVTGLGNRLAYDKRISQLLSQPGQAVTLMLLDLDRFKVVNDSLGHQIGDRLLIEVARRLVALVPEDSVTARMGGDEFVVVPPPGANEDDVRRLAVGIVDALRAPYVLPETGELLVCPASIGIAMSARRRVTGHDLLREADIALYQAKDGGRDRYVIFDEPLRQRTHVRARAERHLREALQDGRLVMEYQPVIDFTNGRLAGAEGLVRLHDSEDGGGRLISPDLFLDIAEQTGLIVEVDCWVIEAAIAQLAQWSEHSAHAVTENGDPGELPWLAINLSARSMEHPRVVRRLIEAVKRGEVQRGRLKIELTEQSFIGALPGVEAALRQLVANGIKIGIDDFGTGYSALAYLQNFDLDFMKIDRSFVVSVGDNPRGDAVVTAIVDLAHAHGMRVIAEGVETSRQARRLREIGCDFAQGYHFGRPGSPSRITPG